MGQQGKTALNLARENKKSKCVTLLEKFKVRSPSPNSLDLPLPSQKESNEEVMAPVLERAEKKKRKASNHPPHLVCLPPSSSVMTLSQKEEPQESPLAPQPSRSQVSLS
jgi:hypothetical protein